MSARRLQLLPALAIALIAIGAVAWAAEREEGGAPPRGVATESWGSLRPSPLRRTEVGAARVGDRIFVVGGFVPAGGATRSVARYDISDNSWSQVRPLPIAVHHPGVTALGGKVYVHGGVRTGDAATNGPTSRLYAYDPARKRWKRLHSGRVPRFAQAFEPIAGKLYAAGGANDGGDLRSVEVYDP